MFARKHRCETREVFVAKCVIFKNLDTLVFLFSRNCVAALLVVPALKDVCKEWEKIHNF